MNRSSESETLHVVELGPAELDAFIRVGVVLVDFWAPWCGPCRMQAPVLEQAAIALAQRARVGKVNVDEHPQIAQRYRIAGIPTLLLFKEGRLVRQLVGVQSASVLISALESLVESTPNESVNPSQP